MNRPFAIAAVLCAVAAACPTLGAAQHGPAMPRDTSTDMAGHPMWTADLGGGWRLLGMAQAFPILTVGAPGQDASPLRQTEAYLTQPVVMTDLASTDWRWVLRTTLNFEGLTLEDGELTSGGWGEGFLDRRHPHTLVHELVLTYNAWLADGGVSLSAGKGFAPFGTDDPMARPGLKYPTNHHLSQILERWMVAGAFLRGGFSVEASAFGGSEPDGPYDFDNIGSFPDSWSTRAAWRWGSGAHDAPGWEASASFGHVQEEAEPDGGADVGAPTARTRLWNIALRHQGPVGGVPTYALFEASTSDSEDGNDEFSILVESQIIVGPHRPYVRIEHARRPEFEREGGPDQDGFFRYEHHDPPIGATRWWIATIGYGVDATPLPASVRPFVDAQFHSVRADRGGIEPSELFGTASFWTLSFGARLFFGGDPMRMGAYGVLDPMVAAHRGGATMPLGEEMGGAW